MNEFSRHLNSIVLKKDINIAQMASFCKIDRSSMYKIVHGTRKPSSESLVQRISLCLKLSPEEHKVLMEKYKILQIGPEKYHSRKTVLSFLKECFIENPHLSSTAFINIPGDSFASGQCSQVFKGELNILGALAYIIQKEKEYKDALVRIRIQPEKMSLDIIRTICESGESNIRIQHILALDGSRMIEDSDSFNLDLISTLMPAVKTNIYSLYYYYTNLNTAKSAFHFLPWAVITRDYVMQFSEDMRFGILHNNRDTVLFFKKIFDDIRSGCIPLIQEIKDYRDLLYVGNHRKRSGKNLVVCEMSLRISYLLTEELLKKYIKKDFPEKSLLTKGVLDIAQKDRQFILDSQSMILSSEKGLRQFMEDGLLPDCPQDLYNPLLPEDRLIILQRFVDLIESTNATFRIVKSSSGNMESRSSIWLEDRNANILLHNKSGSVKVLTIQDPGILILFKDFFQNIPESMCESPHNSMRILQEILQEYSK